MIDQSRTFLDCFGRQNRALGNGPRKSKSASRRSFISATRGDVGSVTLGTGGARLRLSYRARIVIPSRQPRAFYLFIRGVDHRQNTQRCAMFARRFLWSYAVAVSDFARKHELECLRLASDFMQLAGDVESPELQRHFLAMARAWTAEAESGPGVEVEPAVSSAHVRG